MNLEEHWPSVLWKLVMCVICFQVFMAKQYISKELNFRFQKLENNKAFLVWGYIYWKSVSFPGVQIWQVSVF